MSRNKDEKELEEEYLKYVRSHSGQLYRVKSFEEWKWSKST